MRRREFIALFGSAAAAWPLVARAQQPELVRRVGVLMAYAENDDDAQAWVVAFREGLQKLGWVCASAFLIWRPPRSSPSRRVAMWSKFHLYWTGMNGSGSTGRTRACHRRAYSNLDAEITKLEKEKRRRVPYTVEEVQKLFGALKFKTKPREHTIDSALPWVALIAAYSGARREDICSLRVRDLAERNGVLCFAFGHSDYAGKTPAAKRLTPTHSALVAAGLLRYRDNLPADSFLFPGLRAQPSKPDKRGSGLGNHYLDLLQNLGITRRGLNFHSWRNTVITLLQRAGVVVEDRELIVGHEGKGTNRGYVEIGAADLARLAGHVEKIQYPGLVLGRS